MKKLTIAHLAAYLPYGLKGKYSRPNSWNIEELDRFNFNHLWEFGSFDLFKPILRPLSDLTKEITHNGEVFAPIEALAKIHLNWGEGDSDLKLQYRFERQMRVDCTWNHVSQKEPMFLDNLFIQTERTHLNNYWINEKLFEWHFDVFGLIPAGLAIDSNTLENTYK